MVFMVACTAGLSAGAAGAAELDVRVDPRIAAPGDQVVLTVTVSGEGRDLPAPELPAIPGVEIRSGGSSEGVQIVNGAVSTSLTRTYYLRIVADRDVTVPALEVELDGRVVRSDPVVIRVSAATTAPAPGPERDGSTTASDSEGPGPGDDHFVTLSADRATAYVGEQIVLTFRYHANPFARGLDRPEYAPPRTEGFWREDLPRRNFQEIIAGQRYEISEIRYALFPTRPGVLTIEPARVTLPVDPFADFFSSRRRRARQAPQQLSTRAIRIVVAALPEPQPAGFSGVVSRRVDLSAEAAPDTVPRGEPVTLSIALGADGSLKSVSDLAWTPPASCRSHEAGGGLDTKTDHGRLFSRLSQERVLVPTEEGVLALPPVEVVYFDPASETYESVRRDLGVLTVTPGERPVAGDSPTQVLRAEIERLAHDLRFVHPVGRDLRTRRATLAATPLWWGALLAPALLLVLLRWQLTREALRRRDPIGTRRREAWRRARGRLKSAARGDGDAAAAAEVVQAVLGYVADRTGRAAAGLTTADLRAFAAAVGREESGRRLADLVGRCEASRYGREGASLSGAEAARDAEILLSDLDAAVRSAPASALRVLAPLALATGLALGGGAAAQETGPGADPSRLMAEGVEAYTAGDLDRAVARFTAAAATTHDADVYYDLGNAHARRGELGLAVLNYLRAQRLAPRDPDVRANLAWVRSHTRDLELEGTPLPGGLRQIGALLGALSLDELALLVVAVVWLAAVVVAWAWLRGGWTPGRRRLGLAAGAGLLLVSFLFAWRWYDERIKDTAVVTAAEVEVRSGPDVSFPVVFEVHDGLTLQVRALRDGWAQVTLGGEWNGWLPADAVLHVDAAHEGEGG